MQLHPLDLLIFVVYSFEYLSFFYAHHKLHVCSRRLRSRLPSTLLTIGNFCTILIVHLEDLVNVRLVNSVA